MKSRYKRETVEKMLNTYLQAEEALLTGKSYKIGNRELERMDLEEIQKGRAYWENELDKIDNARSNTRVKRVVVRDY